MSRNGWDVAVNIPEKTALASLDSLKMRILMIGTFWIIFGIILGIFLGNTFAKPITDLSENLKILTSGDLSLVVEDKYLKRTNEIGLLAVLLQDMAAGFMKIASQVIAASNSIANSSRQVNESSQMLSSGAEVRKLAEQLKTLMQYFKLGKESVRKAQVKRVERKPAAATDDFGVFEEF